MNTKSARAVAKSARAVAQITTTADAHAAARVQALHDVVKAEQGRVLALVSAIKTTVVHGAYTAEEISANFVTGSSVAVYRSNFNLGHKVGQLLGEAKALQLIDATAKAATGKVYDAVLDALRAAVAAGKSAGGEMVTGKAATAIVATAKEAAKAGAAKREAGKEARRQPRKPKGATAEPAPTASTDELNVPNPRRFIAAVSKAGAGLQETAEALRTMARGIKEMASSLPAELQPAAMQNCQILLASAAELDGLSKAAKDAAAAH